MKHEGTGLGYLSAELAALAAAGLLRTRPRPHAAGSVSFCSNDYLGFAGEDAGSAPPGAGASRLVSGEHAEHLALEESLARWLSVGATLLFTSGYAANVGLLSALLGPPDLVLSDELNHASIVDGCRLARATTKVFAHLDVGAVRTLLRSGSYRRRYVVTESYFSMDADSPDLRALRNVCDEACAVLLVDEAHALGVLGPEGRGLCADAAIRPDALVGTFGKAFGTGGAFVAGSHDLASWLWNRARSFVFSTGLSPALAATTFASLARMREHPARRAAVLDRATQLRTGLADLGLKPLGYGHVVPVVLGESAAACDLADRLLALGFPVQAIRPPSVATGTARLRFTASARQRPADVAALLAALKTVLA